MKEDILLRSVPDSVLSLDAMIDAESLKLSRHVFPTLVIAQGAQPFTSDVLSPRFELLECSKGLRLVLQQINCFEAREVINECDPEVIALVGGDLHRTMHITVDKLEGSGGCRVRSGEGICMHLSSFASFTYWVRISLGIKPETCHQVA